MLCSLLQVKPTIHLITLQELLQEFLKFNIKVTGPTLMPCLWPEIFGMTWHFSKLKTCFSLADFSREKEERFIHSEIAFTCSAYAACAQCKGILQALCLHPNQEEEK